MTDPRVSRRGFFPVAGALLVTAAGLGGCRSAPEQRPIPRHRRQPIPEVTWRRSTRQRRPQPPREPPRPPQPPPKPEPPMKPCPGSIDSKDPGDIYEAVECLVRRYGEPHRWDGHLHHGRKIEIKQIVQGYRDIRKYNPRIGQGRTLRQIIYFGDTGTIKVEKIEIKGKERITYQYTLHPRDHFCGAADFYEKDIKLWDGPKQGWGSYKTFKVYCDRGFLRAHWRTSWVKRSGRQSRRKMRVIERNRQELLHEILDDYIREDRLVQ